MADILFYVFASIAVGGALGVVMAKSPVGSLLFMVVTLAAVAAEFILLEAHFLGAVQIIVYAGAIMVLFLFVIMLLNLQEDRPAMVRFGLRVGAAVVGSLFLLSALRFLLVPQAAGPGGGMRGAVPEGFGSTEAVAEQLFTRFLLAFEVTGVLLLVAIVGAVVLAKRNVA